MTTSRKWLVIAALMLMAGLDAIFRQQLLLYPGGDPWVLMFGFAVVFAVYFGPAMLAKSQTRWFLPVCLLCLLIYVIDSVPRAWVWDNRLSFYAWLLACLIAIASRIIPIALSIFAGDAAGNTPDHGAVPKPGA